MAQYKTGTVVAVNGSNIIVGTEFADWTGFEAGSFFTVKESGVLYDISSFTQETTGTAATYAGGTTYDTGDIVVSSGILYVSLADSNVGNTPASSPVYWAVTSGWTATLTANYAGETAEITDYAIVTDFSAGFNLPFLYRGDIESGAIFTRLVSYVDMVLRRIANGEEVYYFETTMASGVSSGTILEVTMGTQYDSFYVQLISRGKISATEAAVVTTQFHVVRGTTTVTATSVSSTNTSTGSENFSHTADITSTTCALKINRSFSTGVGSTVYTTVRIISRNTQKPASGRHPLTSLTPWLDTSVTPPTLDV